MESTTIWEGEIYQHDANPSDFEGERKGSGDGGLCIQNETRKFNVIQPSTRGEKKWLEF